MGHFAGEPIDGFWRAHIKSHDWLLSAAVIALCALGVIMIYAAANAPATPMLVVNTAGGMWRNQLMFVITGVVMMFGISLVDYKFIAQFYIYIYAVTIILLVAVLIVGGDDGTGTARWFRFVIPRLGEVGIQPSEFAKVFLAVALAKFLDVKQERFNFIGWLAVLAVGVALPVLLVRAQNALSATLVILFICVSVIFVAGLYYRTILILLGAAVPLGFAVWFDLQRESHLFIHRILQPYQLVRIHTAMDPYAASPDARWQLERSLYAISSGGLTGHGFMAQPHVALGHNDFIFSVIASQFGFIGATAVLALIALIIIKCILTALRAEDMTGRLIAAGVAGMLIFETFIHVGVGVGLLPVTGMPLPFVSSGGSMIWGHMLAAGLVLNIAQPRKKGMFVDSFTK